VSFGWFVLICLASYRLTRLVTTDKLSTPLRTWTIRRWPAYSAPMEDEAGLPIENTSTTYPRWQVVLVHCDWCVSVWMALLLTLAVVLYLRAAWLAGVLVWLSAAAVAGLLPRLETI
jgi:hypothetical protein